jgi:hypothetical protein
MLSAMRARRSSMIFCSGPNAKRHSTKTAMANVIAVHTISPGLMLSMSGHSSFAGMAQLT